MSIPSLSPDGSMVAFPESGRLLLVEAASGEAWELWKAEGLIPSYGISWSPDSRFVYDGRRMKKDGPFGLFRIAVSGGEEQACGLEAIGLRHIAVSPDRRRVAFTSGGMDAEVWAVENPLSGRN
jgi:hypothetical protein